MSNVTHLPTRRKLFTHTDLDGVSCAVLYTKAFPHTDVSYVEYDAVNEEVMSFIINDSTTPIMISDMSVSEEVAFMLHQRGNVDLVDHHPTALPLAEKYPWALVDQTAGSATRLMYDLLSVTHHLEDYKPYVDLVDDYDSWGHHTSPQDTSKRINRLLYLLGRDRFYHRMYLLPTLELSPVEEAILQLDAEQEQQYIADTLRLAQEVKDGMGYTYVIAVADRFVNTVGEALLASNPHCEYVMLTDFRRDKVSLRGRGNLHLGNLAKQLGGGGHRRAAGFPLQEGSGIELFFPCKTCSYKAEGM